MTPDMPTVSQCSASPSRRGWYWWERDDQSSAIMVEVRLANGELTGWWTNLDTPVTKLRGSWRGPIPPSTGPASRHKAEK